MENNITMGYGVWLVNLERLFKNAWVLKACVTVFSQLTELHEINLKELTVGKFQINQMQEHLQIKTKQSIEDFYKKQKLN